MKTTVISSLRNREKSIEAINQIVTTLKGLNHQVTYEHLTEYSQKKLDEMDREEKLVFHEKILESIRRSDIVICEGSNESFSVGYLISYAIENGKPTIILYHESHPEPNLLPAILESGKILIARYSNETNLREILSDYIEFAKEKVDVRFNFFISPAIGRYLDWISKVKKIPRSVYLRALIEHEMEENKEYNDQ